MKETLTVLAGTLFFLISVGQVDPNMTIGEFVGIHYGEQVPAEKSEKTEEVLEFSLTMNNEVPKPEPVIVIEDSVEPEITLTVGKPEPLYGEADAKAIAKVMHAEANGLDAVQKRAVGWCILNRVEDWGGTIQGTAGSSAFVSSNSYTEEELALANEVLASWTMDGPRDLPEGYYYFNGNGEENFFRKELSGERISLPSY